MLSAMPVSVPNRLLAALSRKDYQRLLPALEPVELAFGKVLYEPAAKIRHLYFPSDCIVSLLTSVDAHRAAKVGLVGSEGMIGLPVVLGMNVSPFLAVVQGSGTAIFEPGIQVLVFRGEECARDVIPNRESCQSRLGFRRVHLKFLFNT